MEKIPLIVPPLENLRKDQIDIGPHALDKISKDRKIDKKWIYNCLINGEKQGVLKQRHNRFRIYYKHPTKADRYDLIIIIDIVKSSKKNIKVVTTYEQSNKIRVR